MPVRIAVTGVTGRLGGRVAALLAAEGVPLRLVVRDASRAPKLPDAEVAVASYEDATRVADSPAETISATSTPAGVATTRGTRTGSTTHGSRRTSRWPRERFPR